MIFKWILGYGNKSDYASVKDKEYAEILKKNTEWHLWFAWYPVYIGNGLGAFFQHVERKRSLALPFTQKEYYLKGDYIRWTRWQYRYAVERTF